jgi:plasmid maintenance system antidote protein VapI
MTVSFQLPSTIEEHLRRELVDLDQVAKEAALVEFYRQEKLTHHELATALGLDRFETEALLRRHRVTEDCVTLEELDDQLTTLRKLTGV